MGGGQKIAILPYLLMYCRGISNGKAGKAAALPKFSDRLTLSQSGGGGQIMPNHCLASFKNFRDYALLLSFEKWRKIAVKNPNFLIS